MGKPDTLPEQLEAANLILKDLVNFKSQLFSFAGLIERAKEYLERYGVRDEK